MVLIRVSVALSWPAGVPAYPPSLSTQILLNLSSEHKDWGMDEIRERDIRISDELLNILNNWGLNQPDFLSQNEEQPTPTPSPEDLRAISELKRKGLI